MGKGIYGECLMVFRVILLNNVAGKSEVEVSTLTITDGMLIKGDYRTPISNIKYIEEI